MIEGSPSKKWLVTGATGYIGKHVCELLEESGIDHVRIDIKANDPNYESGQLSQFYKVDFADNEAIRIIFEENKIEGVIHLAALKSVSESMMDPELYRDVNVHGTRNLLEQMKKNLIKKFIFTSSAAVYGNIENGIADEDVTCDPTSNYGMNKLEIENDLMSEYFRSISSVALRLFNVAGSERDELKDNGNENLIPIVKNKLLRGEPIQIFGGDYNTKDGTPCRDYIHVTDVAKSFVDSIEYLNRNEKSIRINVGTGQETSVLEIVNGLASRLEVKPNIEISPRRHGDISKLIANTDKASSTVFFKSTRNLNEILKSS